MLDMGVSVELEGAYLDIGNFYTICGQLLFPPKTSSC